MRDDGSAGRAPGRSAQRGGRAQTTIDFAIGAGVFLLAVGFVFAGVPGAFDAYAGSEATQLADRTASSLATNWLGSPATPYVLNATCTVGFFDQIQNGNAAPDGCLFDTTETELEPLVGAPDIRSMNVTIEEPNGGIVTLTADGKTRDLRAGDEPPPRSSVTTASRMVHVDGESYRLQVRVW